MGARAVGPLSLRSRRTGIRPTAWGRIGAWVGLGLMLACHSPRPLPEPPSFEEPLRPESLSSGRPSSAHRGQAIVVCGERYDIGTPVVLWDDPGGYDGYATERHFTEHPPSEGAPAPGELRYTPGRWTRGANRSELFPANGTDLQALGEVVDQFVLHYDVCGTSQRCFRVLHDMRGLSVHFLLDVDGILYQTVDLREQCWHATKANGRSIGIEIAHIGGRSPSQAHEMESWYVRDEQGLRLQFPSWVGDGGVRTKGFVGRPARDYRIEDRIQGEEQWMYDYTPQQYAALVKLSAGLCELFPDLRPDAPRDPQGRLRTTVLSDEEFAHFGGILGHHHVQRNKVDPGVAFDWEPFLQDVRRHMAARRHRGHVAPASRP